MKALMVVGLGFGDEGKGSVVDKLVREHDAAWVCRFNGGCQAQHNVVTEKWQHTFSQFGAGTLAGAGTYLGPRVIVDPLAMLLEGESLTKATRMHRGGHLVHGAAPVVTPFHAAANRLMEAARGDGRHGSCGRGIGMARVDEMEGLGLTVGDLSDPDLWQRLEAIRDRMLGVALDAGAPAGREEWQAFNTDLQRLASSLARADRAWEVVYSPPWGADDTVIFEGAQGVLLDQDHGFHPHTTWSDTTTAWAHDLIEEGVDEVTTIGVTRAYATRHGAGPLPTETDQRHAEPHNATHDWAGAFRFGHMDLVLLDYATFVQPVDELAVMHLDQLPMCDVPVCASYRVGAGVLTSLRSARARLTEVVSKARPIYDLMHPTDLPAAMTALTGAPVTMEGYGPMAGDKFMERAGVT